MKILIILTSLFLALFVVFGSTFGWAVAGILFAGMIVLALVPVGIFAALSKVVNR